MSDCFLFFFFSSRRRHTRCALVTGVQTCALPILGKVKVISCASPGYLERHGVPRTPDDLAAHHLIEYDPALGAKAAGWEWFDGQQSKIGRASCRERVCQYV